MSLVSLWIFFCYGSCRIWLSSVLIHSLYFCGQKKEGFRTAFLVFLNRGKWAVAVTFSEFYLYKINKE